MAIILWPLAALGPAALVPRPGPATALAAAPAAAPGPVAAAGARTGARPGPGPRKYFACHEKYLLLWFVHLTWSETSSPPRSA